ncbi:hypothetical protein QJS66_22330 [Kocuria rhizophila]|nr:hypothetical protein QJS66_22330 [Kocuria rhizophila]
MRHFRNTEARLHVREETRLTWCRITTPRHGRGARRDALTPETNALSAECANAPTASTP